MTTRTGKFVFLFFAIALMVAQAASYSFTLYQPSVVAGKELKAGDYKITVAGDKAVISMGKEKVEVPAKVETANSKFNDTSVRYSEDNGKLKIQEIHLGGTKQKVVFD